MRNYFKYIILGVLALLVVLLSLWGLGAGKKQAYSKTLVENVKAVVLALDFFYNDNNRFPTADEFLNREIMQSYFSNYPVFEEWSQGACSPAFSYSRPAANNYKVDFCLVTQVGEYKSGWNQIIKEK
ncbi:MAG: hypothetical protein JNN11_00915 [Candidatus Doudnabacteria bacterium]|nr:hypothetical protein [Candidatus Doudnabacteria bacterium]